MLGMDSLRNLVDHLRTDERCPGAESAYPLRRTASPPVRGEVEAKENSGPAADLGDTPGRRILVPANIQETLTKESRPST